MAECAHRDCARYRECQAARKKAWHEANREQVSARHKAYREAHREQASARNKVYHEANREQILAWMKTYRCSPLGRLTDLIYRGHKRVARKRELIAQLELELEKAS